MQQDLAVVRLGEDTSPAPWRPGEDTVLVPVDPEGGTGLAFEGLEAGLEEDPEVGLEEGPEEGLEEGPEEDPEEDMGLGLVGPAGTDSVLVPLAEGMDLASPEVDLGAGLAGDTAPVGRTPTTDWKGERPSC